MGVICRDTRKFDLDCAQRLSYFPARELVSLSWVHDKLPMYYQMLPSEGTWNQAPADVLIAGSHLRPSVTWFPSTGRGGMALFTADAVLDLFEIQPADLNDKVLDARVTLSSAWQPMIHELLETKNDSEVLQVLETHLASRVRAIRRLNTVADNVRRQGRYWVERIALQAQLWRGDRSERQVERRIKAMSGRSLRQWQSIVKAEGAFDAAIDIVEAGKQVDWAQLALDEGFSDQAHFNRVTKAVTGFTPSEVAKRYVEDESFWLYRLWV